MNISSNININANNIKAKMSSNMYGIFFEEINHAGDGGLYAELIRNRAFEDIRLPEGTIYYNGKADLKTIAFPFPLPEGKFRYSGKVMTSTAFEIPYDISDTLPGWTLIKEGEAQGTMLLDTSFPRNKELPHALRLEASSVKNGSIGISNSGYWGIRVEKEAEYEVMLYMRCSSTFKGPITLKLKNAGGSIYAQTVINSLTEDWKRYTCTLKSNSTDPNARFMIEVESEGIVWFDFVSMFPKDTFKNRKNGLRKDLAQMIVDMKPQFVRFPGGCFVEGVNLENAYRWKKTIGPIEDRAGHWCLWEYMSTDGLGYHEYLQLCEDLGCPAMYVTNCGMSCSPRKGEVTENRDELNNWLQDAFDAIEYANGSITTEWGAERAKNGHPEPFHLKYLEIGNENSGPVYERNYKFFYEAIKEKYPEVILIANTSVKSAPMDMIDEHFYCKPAYFPANVHRYDRYDRKGPLIYVGEYACNQEVEEGNLISAISEAAFMVGMERNADIVTLASYAPLFVNVNDKKWPVNLICFNSSSCYGIPSYHAQKMFNDYKPYYIIDTVVDILEKNTVDSTIYAVAGMNENLNELIIKVVNFSGSTSYTEINVENFKGNVYDAKTIILTSEKAADANSFENPNKVIPVELPMTTVNNNFRYSFKPYSLTIFVLKIK